MESGHLQKVLSHSLSSRLNSDLNNKRRRFIHYCLKKNSELLATHHFPWNFTSVSRECIVFAKKTKTALAIALG